MGGTFQRQAFYIPSYGFKGGTVDSLKEGVFVWGGVILGGRLERETVYITHTLGIFGWGLDETIYLTTVNKNAKKWTLPGCDWGLHHQMPIMEIIIYALSVAARFPGVASLRWPAKSKPEKLLTLIFGAGHNLLLSAAAIMVVLSTRVLIISPIWRFDQSTSFGTYLEK